MDLLKGEERKYNLVNKLDLEMSKAEKSIRSGFTIQDVERELNYLTSNAICEKEITIKIGAQVMCIVNMPCSNICNGSQGIVTGFCDITGCPRVKFNSGAEIVMTRHVWLSDKIPGVGISQIPLILAWALTIHKIQGATVEMAQIDIGQNIFEYGQTYVALSRIKSLEGLFLSSFHPLRIKSNPKVMEFYKNIPEIPVFSSIPIPRTKILTETNKTIKEINFEDYVCKNTVVSTNASTNINSNIKIIKL
jgi:ATP-dependent DNA helicase PIF1